MCSGRCAIRCRKRNPSVSSIATSNPRTSFSAATADFDFVKILDFGIAKAVHERSGGEPTITSLTVDRVVQGTPAFIAPEQAMGNTGRSRGHLRHRSRRVPAADGELVLQPTRRCG